MSTLSESVHQLYIPGCSRSEAALWRQHWASSSGSPATASNSHCSVWLTACRAGNHQGTTTTDRTTTCQGNWCQKWSRDSGNGNSFCHICPMTTTIITFAEPAYCFGDHSRLGQVTVMVSQRIHGWASGMTCQFLAFAWRLNFVPHSLVTGAEYVCCKQPLFGCSGYHATRCQPINVRHIRGACRTYMNLVSDIYSRRTCCHAADHVTRLWPITSRDAHWSCYSRINNK